MCIYVLFNLYTQKFNHRLISNGNDPSCKTGKGSKWKRDEFKRLLSGIIGVGVAYIKLNKLNIILCLWSETCRSVA